MAKIEGWRYKRDDEQIDAWLPSRVQCIAVKNGQIILGFDLVRSVEHEAAIAKGLEAPERIQISLHPEAAARVAELLQQTMPHAPASNFGPPN